MKGPAGETGHFTLKTVVYVPRLGRYLTVSFRASRPAIVSTLSATPDQRAALRERFRAFALARTDPKELERLAPTVVKSDHPGNTGIIVLKFTKPGKEARLEVLKGGPRPASFADLQRASVAAMAWAPDAVRESASTPP